MPISKVKAVFALGIISVGRAVVYRLGVKLGLNSVKRITHTVPSGPCFLPIETSNAQQCFVEFEGNTQWRDRLNYFSSFSLKSNGDPPDWFYDPFSKQSFEHASKPWWEIPDFIESGRDVKSIWELSRFDWVIAFAQAVAKGDQVGLTRLNDWLNDWSEKNPPYIGPNWKCGQEASIRVLHLLTALLILKQVVQATSALISLIEAHLKRIKPTLIYALAQDNNHGTSEAAALYCGGVFLSANGIDGSKYRKLGKKYLNERAAKLILEDGTFSQYSVNYHRLMLESMSFCALWAKANNDAVFDEKARSRLSEATAWLANMIVTDFGDTPVLGANDGAHLLPITNASYRDYRPAVSLATVFFCGAEPFKDKYSLEHLAWFGFDAGLLTGLEEQQSESLELKHYKEGGFFKLQSNSVSVFYRYPKFAFRPGQCDVMHVDIWANGKNIAGDAGSFSYNAPEELGGYFSGPKGHNTIEFDDRAAMPKFSRFLYGDWLEPQQVLCSQKDDLLQAKAAYTDWKGTMHKRDLQLVAGEDKAKLKVVDSCSGHFVKAILRWRLIDANWQINDHSIACDFASFSISSNKTIERFELLRGWQSLFYMQKQQVPVLEVEFNFNDSSEEQLVITTEVNFN